MIQSKEDLDEFHKTIDPWGYENNIEDLKRKEFLLRQIPNRAYINVLDIGCGQGFITKNLPGENVYGIDISNSAIEHASNTTKSKNHHFKTGSIYNITNLYEIKFDLILITGVLYPQYIGDSSNLIYILIEEILNKNGILVTAHIKEWYNCRFPFHKIDESFYNYREYLHQLEIYIK